MCAFGKSRFSQECDLLTPNSSATTVVINPICFKSSAFTRHHVYRESELQPCPYFFKTFLARSGNIILVSPCVFKCIWFRPHPRSALVSVQITGGALHVSMEAPVCVSSAVALGRLGKKGLK